MAQIQLPTTEPVAQPKASPGEFASPGTTVAELGQETSNLALANEAFEGHLIYAQRQLTYKQIEIDIGKLEEETHNQLRTATTPEEAQQIKDDFSKRMDESLSPHMGDKALARELHVLGQQKDVIMQHNVNAKKADIITKNGRAADGILVSKAEQEAVNTRVAGGNTDGIMEATRQKLNASVNAGIWQPEQVEDIMHRLAKKIDIGEIKAKYNSADPNVRKDIISQLGDDTNFPSLDDADRAAYRVAAEKRNKELNGLGKEHNYNAAVTKMNDATEGWPYENRAKVVTTDKWLKDNDIVDADGNPDHEMGDKLLAEVNRQEATDRKADDDKALEITDKLMNRVDGGKLSDAQIDKLVEEQGGSDRANVKAKSNLKGASHQATREIQSNQRFAWSQQSHAQAKGKKEITANGDKLWASYSRQLTNGETVDMNDVWDDVDNNEMTTSQARRIEAHMQALKDAGYKYNSIRIQNATGLSDAAKAKAQLDLLDGKEQGNLQGNSMNQFADKVIDDTGKKETTNYINKFAGSINATIEKGMGIKPTTPTQPPAKPNGVPDNAVWNPTTKTWQLHK